MSNSNQSKDRADVKEYRLLIIGNLTRTCDCIVHRMCRITVVVVTTVFDSGRHDSEQMLIIDERKVSHGRVVPCSGTPHL